MTVKEIFPFLNQKQRYKLGGALADSFKTIYQRLPDRVPEDGFLVNDYPEFFSKQANKVYKNFLKRLKKEEPQKVKRKRIAAVPVIHHRKK